MVPNRKKKYILVIFFLSFSVVYSKGIGGKIGFLVTFNEEITLEVDPTLELTSSKSFSGYIQGQWKKGSLEALSLKGALKYSRSLSFAGSLAFKRGNFRKGDIGFFLQLEAWKIGLKGSVDVKGVSVFGSDISFKSAEISHRFKLELGESKTELTWTCRFPLSKYWHGQVDLQWKRNDLGFKWELGGDTEWGKLTFKGQGYKPVKLILQKEFKKGETSRRLTVSWSEREGVGAEIVSRSKDRSGRECGLSLKLGLAPIGIKRASLYISTSLGKVSLSLPDESVEITAALLHRPKTTLSAGFHLKDELDSDLKAEIYITPIKIHCYMGFGSNGISRVKIGIDFRF
ncbi:MAG TPA: hypothetical protein ENF77_00275 [Candidatus Acetothermia bacterium]|nr:hypothetical protein [Candidatus Acetothermia bacterium]